MGGSTKVPTPKEPDIGKDISKYVAGYGKALPSVIGLEQQYRPQFGALNLADIGQYQQGLQALQGGATQTAQEQLGAARGAEFAGMTGQAGQVRGLLGAISPESQRMMELQNLQAEQAYASSLGLSPQEQRAAQQGARESYGAAGRLGGNLGIVGEAMGRENILSQKRQEAAGRIGQAYGTSQQFYSPALSLLGGTPTSYGAGQQFMNAGMGMLGQSTPQMINPDTGANLAAAYRRDVLQAQSAQAQAGASRSAGMTSGIGSAIGGIATAKAFMLCIPSGEMIDTVDGKKLIDDIAPNDKVVGFDGNEAVVLQKHSYGENPEVKRFIKISFSDDSSISLCDKHKVNGTEAKEIKVDDNIGSKTVKSIDYFGGVEISYDLLTSDSGYQMSGIPVNSMIPELIKKIIETQNEQ
jgi:hypothetical protein